MDVLYTKLLPMQMKDGQSTILDAILSNFSNADEVDISVGYVSGPSLIELGNIVRRSSIRRICLTIGMYYQEGMPEGCYRLACKLNEEWQTSGVGEVRIIKPFKYHGKAYVFYKDGQAFSAIIGSANLSTLKPDASTLRQYELAFRVDDKEICTEIASHCEQLRLPICSSNIVDDAVKDIKLIPERNTALDNIIRVTTLTPEQTAGYQVAATDGFSFSLPLKVPAESEKLKTEPKYFTKSNINVCYSLDTRNKKRPKSRNWYECQLTVSVDITRLEGYPEHLVPFYLVTDDGYKFVAHTTSQGNKQFAAVGDESIMGRWLKGRLAAAGLVTPINDTQSDISRTGMITKEILQQYGRDVLVFRKTNKRELMDDGTEVDVWTISFESSKPSA